jgi:hypothetical protein
MPAADYIPVKQSDRINWWNNLVSKIDDHAAALEFSPEEIGRFHALAAEEIEELKAVEEARRQYLELANRYQDNFRKRAAEARRRIARGKTAMGYTTDIGKELGWVGGKQRRKGDIALENYQPVLKAIMSAGRIELKYEGDDVDGLNIYRRQRGQQEWQLIGFSPESPYVDTPEEQGIYEYGAIGVKKGKEVGQPSVVAMVGFLKNQNSPAAI